MSVQVQFLEASLAIISIPLEKYSQVFHGIVKLAIGTWKVTTNDEDRDFRDRDNLRHEYADSEEQHGENFFNISITPTECSVICREDLIDVVFGIKYLESIPGISILPRRYLAIKVDSTGLESSNERIRALSSSLSAAHIPIFFLSTYFSDYMLVPDNVHQKVQTLLESNNYVFSSLENSYIALHRYSSSASSSTLSLNANGLSESEARSRSASPPSLADRNPLTKYNLHPSFARTELLITGPRPQADLDFIDLAVVRILARMPKYFSVTSFSDEIALILEKSDVQLFPEDSLLGGLNELYVPVSLDLRKVPVDVVGVVAEVSAKLEENNIPMSFLSTAMTSTVLVSLDYAVKAEALCR